MFNYRQQILSPLVDLKLSSFKSLDWDIQTVFRFRRGSTKLLVLHIVRDIYSLDDERHLVTVSHLYLDYLLHLICRHEGLEDGSQSRRSFAARLSQLQSLKLLNTEHSQTLRTLNSLRNRFAHELFFDLSAWDPREIPLLPAGLRLPRRADLRRGFTILVLRLALVVLVIELDHSNPHLSFQNVPKHARRRA